MKKLLIFAIFIPTVSFGQNFEISEMGGYSKELTNVLNVSGLTDRLSMSYFVTRRFSVGVCYEWNNWAFNNYSIGIVPEFHFRQFYIGANVSYSGINTQSYYHGFTSGGYPDYDNYSSSILYGGHFGLEQKVLKHLFFKEQIGINHCTIKDTSYAEFSQQTNLRSLYYTNLLIGVAYRL